MHPEDTIPAIINFASNLPDIASHRAKRIADKISHFLYIFNPFHINCVREIAYKNILQ